MSEARRVRIVPDSEADNSVEVSQEQNAQVAPEFFFEDNEDDEDEDDEEDSEDDENKQFAEYMRNIHVQEDEDEDWQPGNTLAL